MVPIENVGLFLLQTIFDFYIVILMLRLLLQYMHADYYNPLSQFVIKMTQFIVKPLQRIIPGYKGIDFAVVVLLLLLEGIKITLLTLLQLERLPHISGLLVTSIALLLTLLAYLYFYAIIIRVILSWIGAQRAGFLLHVLVLLTEPILRPLRKAIPTVASFDLSPLVALIGLQVIAMLLVIPVQLVSL